MFIPSKYFILNHTCLTSEGFSPNKKLGVLNIQGEIINSVDDNSIKFQILMILRSTRIIKTITQ